MDNREIQGSFNNSSLENVTIQSDVLKDYNLNEQDFIDLEEAINNADIEDFVKEQNRMYLTEMKSSLNNHDREKAKQMINWIGKSIGNIASVITITNGINRY